MRKFIPLDDGRGVYSEIIPVRAPRGTKERVKAAAAEQGLSIAEYLRRAVNARLSEHYDELAAAGASGGTSKQEAA